MVYPDPRIITAPATGADVRADFPLLSMIIFVKLHLPGIRLARVTPYPPSSTAKVSIQGFLPSLGPPSRSQSRAAMSDAKDYAPPDSMETPLKQAVEKMFVTRRAERGYRDARILLSPALDGKRRCRSPA